MAEFPAIQHTDASDSEGFSVFPVFIIVDVSYSMNGDPIAAVNDSLPALKAVTEEDATVGEIARIGLISFAGTAQTELPLSDLQYVTMPVLSLQTDGTNFAAAFRHARHELEESIQALGKGTSFYRPVVFFLSDGAHNSTEEWATPLRSLRDESFKFRPEIVSIGFNQARAEDMQKIATNYCLMAQSHLSVADQVREIFNLLIRSIQVNTRSAADANATGGAANFALQPTGDSFVQLPPMTV